MVEQDPTLTFEDMAKLSINDLNLLLSAKNTDLNNNITSVGAASSGAYIGEEKAKSIAADHAQVSLSETTFQKVELDYEDGRVVYEVEFYIAGTEYEYEIDAVDGTVLKYELEQKRPASSGTSQSYIGEDEARTKALAHAGLSSSDVQFIKTELDIDDGKCYYDVEFYSGNTEYDYEIDAYDGTILKFDADVEDFTIPTDDSSTAYLGDAKAKVIALQHANLTEGDVTFTKVKLDRDDGRMIYDVEFYGSSGEYEYEIDAFSGAILEWDWDRKLSAQNVSVPSGYISQDKAKSIALERAGLSDSSVTFYEVKLDYDDGAAFYDVEFYAGDQEEYDYEISAWTGEIVGWDYDMESFRAGQSENRTEKTSGSGSGAGQVSVTEAEAKAAALEAAGLKESQVRGLRIHTDRDDGRTVYEGKFFYNDLEYEFEVDAASGRVTDWDVESIYD